MSVWIVRKTLLAAGIASVMMMSAWGQPLEFPKSAPGPLLAKGGGPPAMPKAMTLPQNPITPGASVGYLPASWDVTPSGAFTYSIPLDVPDGRGGMQPALSLNYSSSNLANGPLGIGWSISGLSAVTRCGRSLRVEGAVTGVHYDSDDRFCLDGAKLIALVGDYGADATEYRTENSPYARIRSIGKTANGAPQSFTVETKGGITRTYQAWSNTPRHGEATGNAYLAPYSGITHTDPNSNPVSVIGTVDERWVLVGETDVDGNTVDYQWDNGAIPANNSILPIIKEIHYTSNSKTGDRALRKVVFNYVDSRTDKEFSWFGGVRTDLNLRLASVTMFAPNPTLQSDGTPPAVWTYLLDYGMSGHSRRSRLESVKRCSADQTRGTTGSTGKNVAPAQHSCLWAKQFQWADAQPAPTFTTQAVATYNPVIPPFDPNDPVGWMNNALDDLHPPVAQVLDIDGDGTDDLVLQMSSGNGDLPTYVRRGVRAANGTATPLATEYVFNGAVNGAGIEDELLMSNSRAVDLDGDGKTELLAERKYLTNDGQGNFTVEVRENRLYEWANGKFGLSVLPPLFGSTSHAFNLLDFDGDGRLDAMVSQSGGANGGFFNFGMKWQVWQNVGGSLNFVETTPIESRCGGSVTDKDGDGRGEFVALFDIDKDILDWNLSPNPNINDPSYSSYPYVCRGIGRISQSTGGAMVYDAPWNKHFDVVAGQAAGGPLKQNYYQTPATLARSEYGDFNGDGLEDELIVRRPNQAAAGAVSTAIRWNTGNGYTPEQAVTGLFPSPIDSSWTLRELVGDFNGDGRADILSLRRSNYPTTNGVPDINKIVGSMAGNMVLELSNGDGSFTATPIDGGAGVFEELSALTTTRSGDFNGDGFPDLVRFVGPQLQVLTQTPQYADRILAVYDQPTVWPREAVTYSTQWSDRSEPVAPCAYPISCPKRGMAVTRQVVSRAHFVDPSDEFANTHTLQYSYEDPTIDLRGRGGLGFRKFRTWDASRPMEIVQEFDNRTFANDKYVPGISGPVKVTTVVPFAPITGRTPPPSTGEPQQAFAMNARVTRTYTTREAQLSNKGSTYDTHATGGYTQEWEQQVSIDWGIVDSPANPTSEHIYGVQTPQKPARETHRSTTYDDFGNALIADSYTVGGQSSHVESEFDNRTGAAWLPGLLWHQNTVAAEFDHDPADIVRNTYLRYDKSGHLVYTGREFDPCPFQISPCVPTLPANPSDQSIPSLTTIGYDAFGNITSAKTTAYNDQGVSETRESRTEYGQLIPGAPDEHLYPVQMWSPNGTVSPDYRPSAWVAIQPAYGVPIATMNVNGFQTQKRYDDQGRIIATSGDGAPPGSVVYTARTDLAGGSNGLVVTSSVLGQSAEVVTDALGKTLMTSDKAFDGTMRHVVKSYDLFGRLVSVSRPYSGAAPSLFSTLAYDALDRLQTSTSPDTSSSHNTYSGFFESHVFDASNNETVSYQDVDGRTVSIVNKVPGQADVTTTYAYGPLGVDKVTDDKGDVTHTTYNMLGLPVVQDDPDTGHSSVTYTGFGQIAKRTASNNDLTRMYYDSLGRQIRKNAPNGTDTNGNTVYGDSFYNYDSQPYGIGALAFATSADNVVTKPSYDSVSGRPIASSLTIDNETFRTGMSFDNTGRLSSLAYPSKDASNNPGMSLYYFYNAAEFVSSISPNSNGAFPVWSVSARNLDGALVAGTVGNNGSTVVNLANSYDAQMGRLQTQTATSAGAALLQKLTYGYLANGLVSDRSETVMSRNEHFDYDPLLRLTRWKLNYQGRDRYTDYGYDSLGNLKTVSLGVYPQGVPPSSQQLVETNTYPLNGTQPHTATGHTEGSNINEVYAYDARGRQISGGGRSTVFTDTDLPKRIARGSQSWTFAYDAFGARVKKTGPDGTTIYVGGVYERRGASASTAKHVFKVSGTDGQVAEYVYDATTQITTPNFTLADALGSSNVLVNASGAVTERRYFEPFGKRVNVDGTAFVGSLGDVHDGLTGHEQDDAFGLINMGGRLYDPKLRRFISADPVVSHPKFGQGWNHYSYVLNSPLNLVDPSGYAEKKPTNACANEEHPQVYSCADDSGTIDVSIEDDHREDPNMDNATAADQLGVGKEHNPEYGCSGCIPGGSGTRLVPQAGDHGTTAAGGGASTGAKVDAPDVDPCAKGPCAGVDNTPGWKRAFPRYLQYTVDALKEVPILGLIVPPYQEPKSQAAVNENRMQAFMFGAGTSVITLGLTADVSIPASIEVAEPTVTGYRFMNVADPITFLPRGATGSEATAADALDTMADAASTASRGELHAAGLNGGDSPFVSLVTDPGKLAASTDPWARTIVTGLPGQPGVSQAPHLVQFEIPISKLYIPTNGLSQTETEILFIGDDLRKYITSVKPNPF